MAGVTLKNLIKAYGETQVIHGVDLDIEDGEFVVFVGPSGCGKSTLLRMIAGLEEISGGELSIGDSVVNDVHPSKRGVAMVFQTYALYPHMTVYNNMAFGLKQAKKPQEEIDKLVRAAGEKLQITEYLDRKPKNLSGGQRQRVAIGRAIVRDPEVFLFDEPLSNLDAALRVQTRVEIKRLHEELGATMIYVTHDQVEAMTLADKIVVLQGGVIEQVGSPMELYNTPANLFVAGFIGSPNMNIFDADAADGKVNVAGGGVALEGVQATGKVKLGVRPEHLVAASEADGFIAPRLQLVENLGEYALVHMMTESGSPLTVKFEEPPTGVQGDAIPLSFDPSRAHLFSAADGTRL